MANPQPYRFFALLFAISIPFWVLGALLGGQLLPGLPISALMAVGPTLAAGWLTYRAGGWASVAALLRRIGDYRRMRPWAWAVASGTMPFVMLASALLLEATGRPLPPMSADLATVAGLFVLFFLAAAAEEIGWTAYATPHLVRQRGLVVTGLIIGSVSVAWHITPLLQADRSWVWISWWALGTLARRWLIVWLYVRGGQSVLSATLFHAMNNLSWMLFPVLGSHYDPVSTAIITALLAGLALAFTGNTRALQ